MQKTSKHAFTVAAATLLVAACSNKSGESAEPKSATATADAKIKCLGVNECKGEGQCGGPGGNVCAGQNECKGKGWLLLSAEECESRGGEEYKG